jgi:predicted esterase YcpF (UPF0227 family)
MSVNFEEIRSKFLIETNSVSALVFEPLIAKKVVINFTGMNLGKFERWSWFKERYDNNDNTLYICLKDDEHLFFLDRSTNPNFVKEHIEFINQFLTKHKLTSKDITFTGSSMGGYAAIYYAFLLDAKAAIVANPLCNLKSAKLHMYSLWTRKMLDLGKHWKELEREILNHKSQPKIYIINCQYPADVSAAKDLLKSFEKLKISYLREQSSLDTHTDLLNKETLFKILINF